MRVLLDVNVLVTANEQSQGPARSLLLTLIEQGHTLLMSKGMLQELAAVLRYPRLQTLYGLSKEQMYHYIQFLQHVSEPVTLSHSPPVPIRDPKDTVVLQTAILGQADVICTLDTDFYAPDTMAFCAALGIEVCTDVELAGRIKRS